MAEMYLWTERERIWEINMEEIPNVQHEWPNIYVENE